jgi:hypothetical protein
MRQMPGPLSGAALPGKILAHHLDRQAVVYVRQPTLQQLEHHRESVRVQYGLVDHA